AERFSAERGGVRDGAGRRLFASATITDRAPPAPSVPDSGALGWRPPRISARSSGTRGSRGEFSVRRGSASRSGGAEHGPQRTTTTEARVRGVDPHVDAGDRGVTDKRMDPIRVSTRLLDDVRATTPK